MDTTEKLQLTECCLLLRRLVPQRDLGDTGLLPRNSSHGHLDFFFLAVPLSSSVCRGLGVGAGCVRRGLPTPRCWLTIGLAGVLACQHPRQRLQAG